MSPDPNEVPDSYDPDADDDEDRPAPDWVPLALVLSAIAIAAGSVVARVLWIAGQAKNCVANWFL